jgi:histidinol-phosphate aminotransferase
MTRLDDLPLRDDLKGLTPYGSPQLDVPVPLNTNENPYATPPGLIADLQRAIGEIATSLNRYPDREARELRADLAGYLSRSTGMGLGVEQVWAANGSNEVLQQLLQAFGGPGRTAMGFEPTYEMHKLIALTTATRWVAARRRSDFQLDPTTAANAVSMHRPDVVFLCSPNNPTGTALDLATVAAVCDVAPGIVVVDEAYAEFVRPGVPSAVQLLPHYPKLIVTRTMSKAFAYAGARVGYMAAGPSVIDALRLVRLPYHLSAITQVAARVALAHARDTLTTVDLIRVERDRLVSMLRQGGHEVVPSDANFVLFGRFPDQAAVWQGLLERGVLVRDVGVPSWLRVTAGAPHETDTFLAALHDVMVTGSQPVPYVPHSPR